MRIAVLTLPGSQPEPDTLLALRRMGLEPIEWAWTKTEAFSLCDGYLVLGSYPDVAQARAGSIQAWTPLLAMLRAESERGKPIVGIARGARLLVDAGLVPGIAQQQIGMALMPNQRETTQPLLIRLTDHFQYNAFTRFLTPKTRLPVTLTEAESCFVIPPGLLAEMRVQGLGLFQYCDAEGGVAEANDPTGSVQQLAAVANKAGNVLAMVPNPFHTPVGDAILRSMRAAIEKGHETTVAPLHYQPRVWTRQTWQPAAGATEWQVAEITPDPEAEAVEQVLRQAGLATSVTRTIHWEIVCETPAMLEQIRQAGVLFPATAAVSVPENSAAIRYLIRPEDDVLAKAKQQILEQQHNFQGIHCLRRGVLWRFAGTDDVSALDERICQTPLLYNPHAEACFHYTKP